MSKAIRIHQTGGPEVLRWEEVGVSGPGPGEVLLRQTAVGLNFIDTYHRTGLYPVNEMPAVLGMEGAGVVEEIGAEVTEFRSGDHVAASDSLCQAPRTRAGEADRPGRKSWGRPPAAEVRFAGGQRGRQSIARNQSSSP